MIDVKRITHMMISKKIVEQSFVSEMCRNEVKACGVGISVACPLRAPVKEHSVAEKKTNRTDRLKDRHLHCCH